MSDKKITVRDQLAACLRILAVEREILEMPKRERDWFFANRTHSDCFLIAKALKARIEGEAD